MLVLMQATQPPRYMKVSHVQNDERFTVWAALWRHPLMGSGLFNESPTCETHHQILTAFLMHVLDDISLVQLSSLWFQQNGAKSHFEPSFGAL
jgi:hypothetical protein